MQSWGRALWARPAAYGEAWLRTAAAGLRGEIRPDAKDRRFADPAWRQSPWFASLGAAYLSLARYSHELVGAAGLDPLTAAAAAYGLDLWLDAAAPTNVLWGNPAALRRAWETGGLSLVKGFLNFAEDVVTNGGRPSKVDKTPFRLGENLAATPGKVVFRNHLMELIQYEPQTDTVYEVPLLLSPPWINKYYVMDLAPGRSFAEWAVQRGHTVFAISYRNPDESMRAVSLEDYLRQGPLAALDVIAEITGAPLANVAGLCLGGTLTAMLLAYLEAGGDRRVRSATLLNTLVDFREPGAMGCFLDRQTLAGVNARMSRRGYLESTEMSDMFDALRARDLIWNYVSSGWLMGEKPPAFDILVWNGDGTRMPAEMHSYYLQACYGENLLARDAMELGGRRLRLGAIQADTYVLAAREDHIAPWKSSYETVRLLGGDTRYVLSSSGHVAGIVNPPGGRRKYWTNDEPAPPADSRSADEWLLGAQEHAGSWWEDWGPWIGERAGKRRRPPATGSRAHPPVADAPGEYVHQK